MNHSSDLRRRKLLAGGAGALVTAAMGGWSAAAFAQKAGTAELPFANGKRLLATFPEKREMIVLSSRPPQLETPWSVFNEGIITPNDAFFVRYHNAGLPESVDGDKHAISIGGNAVGKKFSITVEELRSQFKPVEFVAVKQCSGNSRGFSSPRVQGGQSANGAMGNARWVGVPLKDILARAELKSSAQKVTFRGLDTAIHSGDFKKELDVHHAMGGEVMVAYQMNGTDLPMLNGFPVVLVVPGYYATHWVKHLSEIEVNDTATTDFWVKTAYRIPDQDCVCQEPGGPGPAATRSIGRLNVRSFITSVTDGATLHAGQTMAVRGIAFDGGQGIREVAWSSNGGQSWNEATLGKDIGRFSLREFTFGFTPTKGSHNLLVRAWNRSGQSQPMDALWLPSGYMRNVVESVKVTAV